MNPIRTPDLDLLVIHLDESVAMIELIPLHVTDSEL